jgi:hypothetical protein
MRVLKRDMPLSILIDILVQIMFVLSLVFAMEILSTGQRSSGLTDPKQLQAEIDRLKRVIAALEEENTKLAGKLGESEEALSKFVRAGEKDCFSPGKEVIIARWLDSSNILVEKGVDFDSFREKLSESTLLLGEVTVSRIKAHFEPVRRYSAENSCLMFVRFQYPDTTPKDQWMPAWREIFGVFRRGRFEPT